MTKDSGYGQVIDLWERTPGGSAAVWDLVEKRRYQVYGMLNLEIRDIVSFVRSNGWLTQVERIEPNALPRRIKPLIPLIKKGMRFGRIEKVYKRGSCRWAVVRQLKSDYVRKMSIDEQPYLQSKDLVAFRVRGAAVTVIDAVSTKELPPELR